MWIKHLSYEWPECFSFNWNMIYIQCVGFIYRNLSLYFGNKHNPNQDYSNTTGGNAYK